MTMNHRSRTRRRPGDRRGIALIMVLAITLGLAALAVSAVYLSASGGILTRYYDRERDFKYAAEEALALGKSQLNRDTTLALPEDTAKLMLSNAQMYDANAVAIPRIRVNLYGGFTGDTVGRFGQYATLLATSFDSAGTRTVRRLDLSAESFSRYAMFVDSFPRGIVYGNGEFIRGRSHSNTNWYSTGTAPGPDYYDTVSAFGTINGSANYHGIPTLPGSRKIPYPTVAKLAALRGYATAANLGFTPVSGSSATTTQNGVDLSGRLTPGTGTRGTRLRFRPVDVGNDGTLDEADGMIQIFDIAAGIDTTSLRADIERTRTYAGDLFTGAKTPSVVIQNQCGLLVTIGGRKEFFPVARFREPWVRKRVILSTSPTISTFDTTLMSRTGAFSVYRASVSSVLTAYSRILSYAGFSRCFPAGSPYLMLTERYVDAACAVTTSTATAPWGWGSPAARCAVGTRYGGQDTTFTATVTRCAILQAAAADTVGRCAGNQVSLGAWRAWAGAALPSIAGSVIQATEKPYLWPLFKPHNLNSKGVIHATAGPLFVSDTLRGNVTLYVLGHVILIDDTVYDRDPTSLTAICRNFLGIIAQDNVMIADNAMMRPRISPSGSWLFLASPHATLHMVTMSLTGTVGVENYSGGPATSPAVTCGGYPQSGGCINQTGGVIQKVLSPTFSGNNTGFRENRTVDPCQLTNRKPPFFPMTGRYLDNKYYEIDPVNVDTWMQVKAFYARLRG
ncbi:MAG: hypothetical protein FJ202_08145 [Gemmatimonadetes bacterium]|nr:hypothetical protein [Gemmatimonadota bacterium]